MSPIQMIFGKQVRAVQRPIECSYLNSMILQDTHVPRAGRDLIRKTLEDANVLTSVRISLCRQCIHLTHLIVPGGTSATRLHPR